MSKKRLTRERASGIIVLTVFFGRSISRRSSLVFRKGYVEIMIEKDKKIPLCRRSLSFVLALCMGLPLLASCNGGSIPGDGTQGEVTSSDSGTDARFAIISDGKANYSLRADFIVRTCSDIEIDRMNTFFEQLYGARLEFSDAEPYIELKYDGDMRSYSVTLDEESGNITITGG